MDYDRFVGVSGITGPVKLSAGSGQATVIGGSGPTDVRAVPKGYAVWAGCQGPVRVEAELGIYLRITDVTFEGTLDAMSQSSIHVWVPPGLAAGIHADVARDAGLDCRADLARTAHRTEDGRIVWTCGAGPPQLRLTSRAGNIVIGSLAQDDGAR